MTEHKVVMVQYYHSLARRRSNQPLVAITVRDMYKGRTNECALSEAQPLRKPFKTFLLKARVYRFDPSCLLNFSDRSHGPDVEMSTQPTIEVICPPEPGSLTCLTRAYTAGFTMTVAASLLSLGSVLYAFFFIVNANRHTSTRFRIFYNSMDVLVFALLFADLVQAIGGLLSLKWIRDGIVQTGVFCSAQGILKTLGETSDGLTALLIAVYTFVGVSTGNGLESMRMTIVLVVGIWIFVGILIGIGHATTHGPYMTPAPFWCWVGPYTTWRIIGEYLWLWTSLFVSCLLYIPLCLWMRGNLVFDEVKWYAWSFQWTVSNPNVRLVRRKALVMLLYPIIYCICILPLSIVRWMTFKQEAKYGTANIPPAWNFTVSTIFGLSGFLNVILVLTTKPNLGLFGRHEVPSSGRPPSPSLVNQFRPDTASAESGVVELSMKRLSSQADATNPSRQRASTSNVMV